MYCTFHWSGLKMIQTGHIHGICNGDRAIKSTI